MVNKSTEGEYGVNQKLLHLECDLYSNKHERTFYTVCFKDVTNTQVLPILHQMR